MGIQGVTAPLGLDNGLMVVGRGAEPALHLNSGPMVVDRGANVTCIPLIGSCQYGWSPFFEDSSFTIGAYTALPLPNLTRLPMCMVRRRPIPG